MMKDSSELDILGIECPTKVINIRTVTCEVPAPCQRRPPSSTGRCSAWRSTAECTWTPTSSTGSRVMSSGKYHQDVFRQWKLKCRERDLSVLRFSNSSNISEGMMVSSSPQYRETSRIVNISHTSSQQTFARDLQAGMLEDIPPRYILDTDTNPPTVNVTSSGERVSPLAYRLSSEIMTMDQAKIESSEDDLSKILSNIWNDKENTNSEL